MEIVHRPLKPIKTEFQFFRIFYLVQKNEGIYYKKFNSSGLGQNGAKKLKKMIFKVEKLTRNKV